MISSKLTDYLQALLGNTLDNATVPDYIARQISAEDTDERYVHVEGCVIWRKSSWLISQKRETYIKTLSAHNRSVWTRRSELINELIRALQRVTGLDEEIARQTAEALIATRNPAAAQCWGLDMTELLEADKELREFKERTNTK